MPKVDADLDRLLRAAAAAPETEPLQAPFGFETRVVATWRAQRSKNGGGMRAFALFLRRVMLGGALVAIFASAGAYWQISENNELSEPTTNTYAIADSAIEASALP